MTYHNAVTGEVVIGFGGTEDLQDFWNDIRLGLTNHIAQEAEVQNYVTRVLTIISLIPGPATSSIVYTGHSLGGYLAQFAEMNDTSGVSSAVVYNSTGFPVPSNGVPSGVDVTYIYTDPQYWDEGQIIHNLDDRLTDQVYYVLDATNTNGQYNGAFGGHQIQPLRDAIAETLTNPNTQIISEAI